MNQLYIAEKPSLGRAIADGLGNGQKQNGYIVCGENTVTWCFGHILEQLEPQEYDSALRFWQRRDLPIVPEIWKLKPRAKVADQLKLIGELLAKADSVVHAGDPDREGQLLVDEVLEHFDYRGSVQRIWLASLDNRSVAKALATLTDNKKHAPLRDAARARAQADWLIGMNGTRAMSILGRESGRSGTLSLGRVQTPTLALVVNRDREIAVFKPIDYFALQASLEHSAGSFAAFFQPGETQPGLDSQGRLVDPAVVTALADSVRGQSGTILEVTREKKKKAVPLPHCLSSLQKAASTKFGMTAQAVLDTAQSLYEKKLTTYPRSDCRYLPDEQFADAERILTAVSTVSELDLVTSKANPKLKGPVWDTKKITAHHAIIPTGEVPGTLSKAELDLYLVIAQAYCLQFYPPLTYEAQKITVNLKETRWEARGRLILEAGWTGFDVEEDGDAKEEKDLPAVSKGDTVTCADVEALKKKTSPPPRFSEGTLIEAMANIHRFVTDAKAKAMLKENEGIGTEATRAGILETLKKRKYIVTDGKGLVSTPLGQEIIDLTPESLKDPVTTAQWESSLGVIANGKETLEQFMAEQVRLLPELVGSILKATPELVSGTHPCPTCGKALARRDGKDGGFFWSCSAYPDCNQPTLPDDNGKPGERKNSAASAFPCPECGNPMYFKEKDNGGYWGCLNKAGHPDGKPVFLPDDNGKPGVAREKKPRTLTDFTCKKCGKPFYLLEDIGKNGKPYQLFSCSGYPDCKESCFGTDGVPDFEGKK